MEENVILQKLGLEPHESNIYLLLVNSGESTAVTLSKDSQLHRRTVYDTLERLQKKGLVSLKIKKFVKYYSAVNPEALMSLLKEKQALLKQILPTLVKQFNSYKPKVSVSIYEGTEGMKTILSDALDECERLKDEVVMLGAGLRTPDFLKYSFPHYVERLRNLKWRLIEPDLPHVRSGLAKWDIPINCRYLNEKFLAPVGIIVFSDRTIVMLLDKELILIQIIGLSYANAFRNYFEILWRAAKN